MADMSGRGMMIPSQAEIGTSMEHSQSRMMNQYQMNEPG